MASRNGSSPSPTKPKEGERGVTAATSYLGVSGESLFRYGGRTSPGSLDLDKMIRFDPWADAIEGALTWPIRSGEWAITPVDGDRGEAEEATRQFGQIARRAVAGSLSAVGRRVAYAEQVWELGEDRRTAELVDLAFRPIDQCTVIPDHNGRPTGFRQRAFAPGRGFVSEDFLRSESKAFVYLHDSATRPGIGKSALESAYQHHLDKQKLLFYRYKSLEKFGGPSTHGKTDAPEGSKARESFESAVRDMRSGAAVTTDTMSEINYLAPPDAKDAFQRAIHDLNFEMAVASFVQWLALAQEGNSGAYELSRDHSDFLTIVTEGRMAELADAFTRGPIYDIVFHNFGPGAAFPEFEFEPISEHTQKLIRESADLLFRKNGMVPPQWLAEGITEGYGASLGIEKPDGAESSDPVGKPVPANTSSGQGEGTEGGEEG